jgi:hypothetical protein
VWANHSIRLRAVSPDVRCFSAGRHLRGGIPIPSAHTHARTHAAPFPLRGFPADEIRDRGRLSPPSPEGAELGRAASCALGADEPREPFSITKLAAASTNRSPGFLRGFRFTISTGRERPLAFFFSFLFYLVLNRCELDCWKQLRHHEWKISWFWKSKILRNLFFFMANSLIPRRNHETRRAMEYHPTKWRRSEQ